MSRAILVVEDETSLNHILKLALEDEGYHVRVALDGEKALQMLQELQVQLVVLDYALPTLDGEQIITAMQASDILRTIPVIVITGSVNVPSSLSTYAQAILQKPFNLLHLLGLVAALLPPEPEREINGSS